MIACDSCFSGQSYENNTMELAGNHIHYQLDEVVVGEDLVGDGVHGGVHI